MERNSLLPPELKMMDKMPIGILGLFLIASFTQSFPATAFMSWMSKTLTFTPAQFTLYYTLTFIPWQVKPIYGMLSDYIRRQGYSQKILIIMFQLGAASTYVVTALSIHSILGAFLIKIVDSTFEAGAQTIFGILIAELANGDVYESGILQSYAMTARNIGSLSAYVIGIPVYMSSVSPTTIIGITAVFPFIGAIYCYCYVKSSTNVILLDRNPLLNKEDNSWKTLKDQLIQMGPFMLFLCLSNALPTDTDVWSMYQMEKFGTHTEYMQYTSISSILGRLFGSIIYGKYGASLNKFGAVFIMAAVFSSLSSIPRVFLTFDYFHGSTFCYLSMIDSFVTNFAKQFALLPLIVVATYNSPMVNRGMAYSIYLSVLDLGVIISGTLSAYLLEVIHLTQDPTTKVNNFDNLYIMVILCAASQLLVLKFLVLIKPSNQQLF